MLPDPLSSDFCFILLECAREHGENSDPDHEVGDLQDLFVSCWRVMTPDQRRRALADPEVQTVMEGPEYEDLLVERIY